tara:strand:+ start:85 stop:660 length:576 start_codon:yes stop_codon:yes gene_type:complete
MAKKLFYSLAESIQKRFEENPNWYTEHVHFWDAPPPTELAKLRAAASQPLISCECCGGPIKCYKRKLTSTAAAIMCFLYSTNYRPGQKQYDLPWTHKRKIPREFVHGGEIAQLKHWNLMEEKLNDDSGKRTSGIWRLTQRGVVFVRGGCKVPSHIFVQSPRNKLLGFEETKTDIETALGNRFNYEELMQGI